MSQPYNYEYPTTPTDQQTKAGSISGDNASPGSASDVRALNALPLNLPLGSEVYTDAAYTDYHAEDDLFYSSQIELKVMRKKNSKRKDQPWNQYIKQCTRHYIETGESASLVSFQSQSMQSPIKGFY